MKKGRKKERNKGHTQVTAHIFLFFIFIFFISIILHLILDLLVHKAQKVHVRHLREDFVFHHCRLAKDHYEEQVCKFQGRTSRGRETGEPSTGSRCRTISSGRKRSWYLVRISSIRSRACLERTEETEGREVMVLSTPSMYGAPKRSCRSFEGELTPTQR